MKDYAFKPHPPQTDEPRGGWLVAAAFAVYMAAMALADAIDRGF